MVVGSHSTSGSSVCVDVCLLLAYAYDSVCMRISLFMCVHTYSLLSESVCILYL